MVLSVTSVPIMVLFCRFVLCLPVYHRACKLVSTTTGSIILSTFLAFDNTSADVMVQLSSQVGYSLSDTDERWFHFKFDSASVHGVPSCVVETRKYDSKSNIRTRGFFGSRKVCGSFLRSVLLSLMKRRH